MESVSIRNVHGVTKVLGSVVSLSGALVFAFVKGPPLKFMMNWYPSSHDHQDHQITKTSYERKEWIKGSLMMLSANTAWSLWLILQVPSTLLKHFIIFFQIPIFIYLFIYFFA